MLIPTQLKKYRRNLNHIITLGSSLNAVKYAYQHNTKLVLNELRFPNKFESGQNKETWGTLYTKLSLQGQIVGGDTVKKVKISEDQIHVFSEYNIVNKLCYNQLFVFSDKNILGLPPLEKEKDEYEVIDVLNSISLVSSCIHKIIKTKDSLVRELYIIKPYQSSPIEIYAVSSLTKKQLEIFDYSDTMVKFKSEHLLEINDFKGCVTTLNKRSPINLETVRRIVHKKMDLYEETKNVKFFYGN